MISFVNRRLSLCLILIISVLSSCSNDDEVEPTPPVPKSKVTLLDGYLYNGKVLKLAYDSLNRVTDIESLTGADEIISNTITYYNSGELHKIGDGTFAYDSDGNISNVNNGENTGASSLTYDSKGLPVEQITQYSSSGVNVIQKRYFEHTENRLTTITDELTHESSVKYARYEIEYNGQNNISKIVVSKSDDDVNYTVDYSLSFIYDNKINPWSLIIKDQFGFPDYYVSANKLLESFAHYRFEGLLSVYPFDYMAHNNLVSVTLIRESSQTVTKNYTYVYNDADLPLTVDVDIIYSDSEDRDSEHYEYAYVEREAE